MSDPTFTAPPTAPARTDAPAVFNARADAFLAWFATLYTELQAFVVWVNASIASISAQAADTLAALVALANSAGYIGTSTTSRAVGTGSKAFVTQTNRAFRPGAWVIVADSAAPDTNWLFGQVTAYDPATGDLTVNVTLTGGSGTKSAWTISLSAPRGATATFTGGPLTSRTDLASFTEKQGPYSSGAMDVSSATGGSVFDASISATTTVSLSGLPSSPATGQTVTAQLRAAISSTPTITWPSGIKWNGGTAPPNATGRLIVTITASWNGSAWVYDGSWGSFA